MYSHLLVALDGSALAEQVLPYVEALASKFGSRITLLRATTSLEMMIAASATAGGAAAGMVDPMPYLEAEQQEASAYLETHAARLRRLGLTVNTETPQGPPAEMILQRTRDLGADLIAMTTHGRGGLGRLFFGSVAEAVLRHSSCPVLLVRASEGG